MSMSPRNSLEALAQTVRHELELLNYPNLEWLPEPLESGKARVHDVLIVGGGQAGLALSFALRRELVRNVLVLDRAPAGQEGPWRTFARMRTLRTPKYLTGLDIGVPSLTFRAWYEAQPTLGQWDSLDRIPRLLWSDYLDWYRTVLDIDVHNECEVALVEADEGGRLAVTVRSATGVTREVARKVVFCNGIDGAGEWRIPAAFSSAIAPHLRAHTSDYIDFSELKGKKIAVLGAGASAMDAATMALDNGASRVDLFCRRPHLLEEEQRGWLENNGFLSHYCELDDARKWKIMKRFLEKGSPAPAWSIKQASENAEFHQHLACSWIRAWSNDQQIFIETNLGHFCADFAIFGTGQVVDLRLRTEFSKVVHQIATWGDRYAPPPDESYPPLELYPYLGIGYQLTEKHLGQASFLSNIHLFNWAATASNGVSGSNITGMKFGLRRVVDAVTKDLYFSIADQHAAAFTDRRAASSQ